MKWNDRLKKAREDMLPIMGKSAFARAVGVSAATVTNWENGKVTELKGKNLMKVCEVLGISESWLMDGIQTEGSAQEDKKLALTLDVRCETAGELRLLTAYRLANLRERIAINHAIDAILERLPTGASNEAKPGRRDPL